MATVTAAKGCPFSNASIDFDPFDINDPFAFYEWARAEAPVFFSDELQYYVVAGHADIKAVFEDWRTFSSENAQAPLRPIGAEGKRIMREAASPPIPVSPPAYRRTIPAFASWFRVALARAASRRSSRKSGGSSGARSTPSSVTATPSSSVNSPTTSRLWSCSSWWVCRMRMWRRLRPGRSVARC